MRTYLRCTVCYRDVKAVLAELYNHCDAYHYGQSPDLIFPHHDLHYKPMDPLARRDAVASGEGKMGKALLSSGPTMPTKAPQIEYIVVKPQLEIQHDPEPRMALESNPMPKQMRVKYLSSAWEELVCQNWVTIKTELQANGDDIAIMEQH